eukprot:scaffold155273_cov20-Tisochrysis_lutea.AAC.1
MCVGEAILKEAMMCLVVALGEAMVAGQSLNMDMPFGCAWERPLCVPFGCAGIGHRGWGAPEIEFAFGVCLEPAVPAYLSPPRHSCWTIFGPAQPHVQLGHMCHACASTLPPLLSLCLRVLSLFAFRELYSQSHMPNTGSADCRDCTSRSATGCGACACRSGRGRCSRSAAGTGGCKCHHGGPTRPAGEGVSVCEREREGEGWGVWARPVGLTVVHVAENSGGGSQQGLPHQVLMQLC